MLELSSESFSEGGCHFVVFNLEDLSGHITNVGYIFSKVFIVINGEIV